MKTTIYRSETRGHENHGWLNARHTFSFANYYDPSRIHFGALRVLNDDIIAGGKGFGMHGHDNMEIVTIPLSGSLCHEDSLGHKSIIKAGDVQVMSAGSGILHSEYNADETKELNLFQIWIMSNQKNVVPRYKEKTFQNLGELNVLHELVSPINHEDNLWIYQNAWVARGVFDKAAAVSYSLKSEKNGLFLMVISGKFVIEGVELCARDAIGIEDVEVLDMTSLSEHSDILLIDVPMRF